MACSLLQHVRCVQQVHSLLNAVVDLEHSPTLDQSFELAVPQHSGRVRVLTQKAACVIKLVLESQHTVDLSAAAAEQQATSRCLRWIKEVVYGSQAADAAIMHLVYSSSVEQAEMTRHLCIQIVQRHLQVSNCFKILETAMQTGILCLLRSSLDLASHFFNAALKQDCIGWAAMSKEGVALVLCSSNLQVSSEIEVFEALVTWVEACPQERVSLFEDLFVQTVQVHRMLYEEAQLIDSHPLVAKHQTAYMHVAHALLAWHMQKPGLLTHNQPVRSTRVYPSRVWQAAVESPVASMQNHADSAMQESLAQKPSAGHTSQVSSQSAVEQTANSDPLGQMQPTSLHLQQHDQSHADQQLQSCSNRHSTEVSQQNWQHELSESVSLSFSMDETMLPELDADVSSRLQLCSRQCGGSKDAPQICVSDSAFDDTQPMHLTVRTGQSRQAVSFDVSAQLQHEMAVSPSAQQGRRKQAMLGSVRSLKF